MRVIPTILKKRSTSTLELMPGSIYSSRKHVSTAWISDETTLRASEYRRITDSSLWLSTRYYFLEQDT